MELNKTMISKVKDLTRDSLAYAWTYAGLFSKPRTGWINRNVQVFPWQETVGGHSLKLEIAAGLYAPHKNQDPKVARTFARYHDFPERIAPDRAPSDPLYKEKHLEEAYALDLIVSWFSPRTGDFIQTTWHGYERREKPEALTIYNLDKADPVVQSVVYRRKGHDHVSSFRDYAYQKINDPTLKSILDMVIEDEFAVNPYLQYFTLLHFNGDEKKFRVRMGRFEGIPGINAVGF